MQRIPELVCPAGNLPALKTAVDNGADTVYMGLKDATNARNFPGLNFDMKSAREGVAYAHARGRNVLMAINTFAQAGQVERWHAAVDTAADLGADAIIVADPAIMAYFVCDGGRPLHLVELCNRRIAQYARCLLSGKIRPLGTTARPHERTSKPGIDRPIQTQ